MAAQGEMTADLRLIGDFELRVDGRPVRLGLAAQRLLALLAIRRRPMSRAQAAGALWPDVPADRATANLRSVMWRLRKHHGAFARTSSNLLLGSGIQVDLTAAEAAAGVLSQAPDVLPEDQLSALLQANFSNELLPDWCDQWLIADRERFRQLRLHALEALCAQLSAVHWHGSAIDAGLAVVATDPLRESAHSVLIQAYLAEGNYSDALRQFRRYSELVRSELHVNPSPRLREMVRAAFSDSASRVRPRWLPEQVRAGVPQANDPG